jgi:hypothetical protein
MFLTLLQKYVQQKFYSTKGEYQRLDPAEIEIIHSLTDSGKLYKGDLVSIISIVISVNGFHSNLLIISSQSPPTMS